MIIESQRLTNNISVPHQPQGLFLSFIEVIGFYSHGDSVAKHPIIIHVILVNFGIYVYIV